MTPSSVRLGGLLVGLALLFAVGCASSRVGQRTSADHSLLAIHIDLSRSPSYWRKVALLCQARGGGQPWWHMHTDGKGLYYQEGVPPGRCWITGGFQDGIVTRIYKLPMAAESNPTTTAVPGPGVHYMGAWRFVPKSGDDFDFVPAAAPGAREALQRLLPWTKGTAWDGMVRKRL